MSRRIGMRTGWGFLFGLIEGLLEKSSTIGTVVSQGCYVDGLNQLNECRDVRYFHSIMACETMLSHKPIASVFRGVFNAWRSEVFK